MRRVPPSLSERMVGVEATQIHLERRVLELEQQSRQNSARGTHHRLGSLERWRTRVEPELEAMRAVRSTWRVVTGGSVVALVASIVSLGKLLGWW